MMYIVKVFDGTDHRLYRYGDENKARAVARMYGRKYGKANVEFTSVLKAARVWRY